MSEQWKPGDVVFATVHGAENVQAVRMEFGWYGADGWCSDTDVTAVSDVRRAFVLDLTPEQAEWLAEVAEHSADGHAVVVGFDTIVSQIRAQIPKREPRPEPDGIGTVATLDYGLCISVRPVGGGWERRWVHSLHGTWHSWDDIEPRVIDIKTHGDPVTP